MAGGSPEEMVNGSPPPPFDTSVAHIARVYNYWLGGKDNFAADRAAGEQSIKAFPEIGLSARSNRAFLARAVRFLAGECEVRQFLDIGTGIPTANNTHEVAQAVAPAARVVYVDNDPVVLTHAQALLTSSPAGKTDYLYADLRDTGKILAGAARTLDFSRPVAVLLIAVMHFIPDADDPYGVVKQLLDAVPPGSYLVLSHGASDIQPEVVAEMMQRYNALSSASLTLRDRQQVTRFFDGLELVPPGVVPIAQWARESADAPPGGMAGYCGIAAKP